MCIFFDLWMGLCSKAITQTGSLQRLGREETGTVSTPWDEPPQIKTFMMPFSYQKTVFTVSWKKYAYMSCDFKEYGTGQARSAHFLAHQTVTYDYRHASLKLVSVHYAEEMPFRFHFLLLFTTYYGAQNMDREPQLLKWRLRTWTSNKAMWLQQAIKLQIRYMD